MWSKVYKWTLGILIVAIIGLFLFFGVKLYLETTENPSASEEETDNEKLEDDSSEHKKQVIELSKKKNEQNKNANYVNPFGDTETKEKISEKRFMKYINYMAHQKVEATDKWGFYQITSERIQFLLETLEQKDYQHQKMYRPILKRWNNGDFSQAVEDHNKIWRLQNGNVGKATRLYTEEEEQAFLDKYAD